MWRQIPNVIVSCVQYTKSIRHLKGMIGHKPQCGNMWYVWDKDVLDKSEAVFSDPKGHHQLFYHS